MFNGNTAPSSALPKFEHVTLHHQIISRQKQHWNISYRENGDDATVITVFGDPNTVLDVTIHDF